MKTSSIISHIREYIDLDQGEADYVSALFIPRAVRQGEVIVESGAPPLYMIHVSSGYLMTSYTDELGHDHVVQFATAGWWTGDLYSLDNDLPTIYTTRALTDGEVLLFPKAAQELLLNRHIKFERYFRIIFQYALKRLQLRIIENYSLPAERRYLAFCEKYPGMEQYVPQKYIASYLGITPEFLSKIRGRLAKK